MRVKKCNMQQCSECYPLTAWIEGEPRSYKCSSQTGRIRTLMRLRMLYGSRVPNVFACYLCLRDEYALMGDDKAIYSDTDSV